MDRQVDRWTDGQMDADEMEMWRYDEKDGQVDRWMDIMIISQIQ